MLKKMALLILIASNYTIVSGMKRGASHELHEMHKKAKFKKHEKFVFSKTLDSKIICLMEQELPFQNQAENKEKTGLNGFLEAIPEEYRKKSYAFSTPQRWPSLFCKIFHKMILQKPTETTMNLLETLPEEDRIPFVMGRSKYGTSLLCATSIDNVQLAKILINMIPAEQRFNFFILKNKNGINAMLATLTNTNPITPITLELITTLVESLSDEQRSEFILKTIDFNCETVLHKLAMYPNYDIENDLLTILANFLINNIHEQHKSRFVMAKNNSLITAKQLAKARSNTNLARLLGMHDTKYSCCIQ